MKTKEEKIAKREERKQAGEAGLLERLLKSSNDKDFTILNYSIRLKKEEIKITLRVKTDNSFELKTIILLGESFVTLKELDFKLSDITAELTKLEI